MSWQLRTARATDLAAIMAIEAPTFGTDAWSATTVSDELADPNTYYLVAFAPDSPDDIVAYAGLLSPRGAFESDIQTIAVAPSARGGGLGRVLMQTLITEARARGARETFLEVRADNPGARRLYERLGFTEIGVRPRYYQPDGVDAVVMRLVISAPQPMLASENAREAPDADASNISGQGPHA